MNTIVRFFYGYQEKHLKNLAILLIAVLTVCLAYPAFANPRVRLETRHGIIVLELDPQSAPETVKNFLRYVDSGFYNDTTFHRVIKGFMIQGGGLTADMHQKLTQAPIMNEADNGLKNHRGTIAMARTSAPHSATSQFFINTVDNTFLDHRDKTSSGWGYCVFGKVIEGMHVVDTIENSPTTVKNGHRDVPAQPIIIERAVLEE
ncbi:MAG: peptidylprolyl isomerase [Candidatus Loosdrechtia sp.]|uniref:peptidylprolyl isomerase n=1 Tax=Candidatus Loosdrechtia sp. TaxID=3101272 RepID=UPI00403AB77F